MITEFKRRSFLKSALAASAAPMSPDELARVKADEAAPYRVIVTK